MDQGKPLVVSGIERGGRGGTDLVWVVTEKGLDRTIKVDRVWVVRFRLLIWRTMARVKSPALGAGLIGSTLEVSVTAVLDGDSLVVTSRDRRLSGYDIPVRLFGIDAPEKGQIHGEEARRALLKLATGTRHGLVLEVMAVDRRWDRVVGLVYHRGGDRSRSINLAMVEEGHARWYRQFGGSELGFSGAERLARERRKGLWRNRRHMAPWVYRVRQREALARRRRWIFRLWLLFVPTLVAVYGYLLFGEDLNVWVSDIWEQVLNFGDQAWASLGGWTFSLGPTGD